MEDIVNRNVVYSFSYIDKEYGRQVTSTFHPADETWDSLLPEFKQFLLGIGFQFNVSEELRIVDTSEVKND